PILRLRHLRRTTGDGNVFSRLYTSEFTIGTCERSEQNRTIAKLILGRLGRRKSDNFQGKQSHASQTLDPSS
ncbi:MAG TPA: hypothetical protein VNO32_32845, partial [Candidatus Acidoferrum sp.]|nr:hypothetical protein [Candidatus Acidoferrum sp.]